MPHSEVWRAVPSLPDYEASSLGRIRRVPHEKPMPRGGVRIYGSIPWFGVFEKKQRRYIFQYKGKTYRVAKIVCEAFHGKAPVDKPNVLHKDEDSKNNKPENLEWGTQKKNLNMPKFLEYCRSRTGENNPLIRGKLAAQAKERANERQQ